MALEEHPWPNTTATLSKASIEAALAKLWHYQPQPDYLELPAGVTLEALQAAFSAAMARVDEPEIRTS